jgi:hypothetical protein
VIQESTNSCWPAPAGFLIHYELASTYGNEKIFDPICLCVERPSRLFRILDRFDVIILEQLLEPSQCALDGVGWDKKSFPPSLDIDIVRDLIALDLGPGLPPVGLDGCFLSISSAAAADCDFINATPRVTGSGSLSSTM